MKRVGALVGAVVMVIGALALRGVLDDDGAGGGDGGDTATSVLCPTEFAELCRAVEATTEDAGATADRLIEAGSADDLDAGAWIVPSAWAELVLAERARLGHDAIFEITEGVIASSAVTLVVWEDQAPAVASMCGHDLDWACIAEVYDQPIEGTGNTVQSGSPHVESATGLVVAAAQAGSILGRDDFASNDFDGRFRQQAILLASGQESDPLREMRLKGPGDLTVAGVVAADATNPTSNLGSLRSEPDLPPGTRADLVAVVPAGDDLEDDTRDRLAESFTAAGWDRPGSGAAGLPSGGVLAALRTLWNET